MTISDYDLYKVFTISLRYLDSSNNDDTEYKEEFICNAISLACSDGWFPETHCVAAKAIITERIKPSCTFDSWLRWTYPELKPAMGKDQYLNSGKKLQATRLAWMKSMAAEFLEASKKRC